MNISVISASTPEWGDVDRTIINLSVEFSHLSGQEIIFSASPSDSEAHGRELYERAIGGEFGEIAPYSGPSKEEIQRCDFLHQRQAALQHVELMIAPLERARRLGMATPEELKELEALEVHSVNLMRAEGPALPKSPVVR